MKLKITLCLAAAAALLAILATPALAGQAAWIACQEYPELGQWEDSLCSKGKEGSNWATQEVTETMEVTSNASTLELTDTKATGGSATIKCAMTDTGWIEESLGGISKINTTKCERASGLCESGKEAKVTAIDLPWNTELREESGGEVRDILQAGGKGPGYKVECTVEKVFKVADECFGAITTKMRNNHSSETVEAEYESKSEKVECSLGGKGSGEIKGVDAIKKQQPGGVQVGPPSLVFRTGGDLDFGTLAGGVKKNTERTERFRFENPRVAVTYNMVKITGSAYSLLNTTCNGNKGIGSTCTTELKFEPASTGDFLGLLEIRYTYTGGTATYIGRMEGIGLP